MANLFVADAIPAAAANTNSKPPCEPCSTEEVYFVESQYFDLENLTKPIDDFQEKLNLMIFYINLDDGDSRSSYPSGPVSVYFKRVSS